jgi:phage terminase small subunit
VSKDTLTPREEAFAHAVADGLGPSEAYRQSHGSKMAPDAVASNAKRLLRRSRVRRRIAELKAEGAEGSGLTPKREQFCWLYVEKSNASEAYRLSHDVAPNTKPETIHRNAHELLKDTKVTARIEAIRAELRERNAITLDKLVEKLRPIIDADIRKVVTWGDAIPVTDPVTGETRIAQGIAIKSMAELDDAAAAIIAKIRQSKDGSLSVELHDKLAAIEKVAKLLGYIKEQHEHSGSVRIENPTPQHPGHDHLADMADRFLGGLAKHNPEEAARARADYEAADGKKKGPR